MRPQLLASSLLILLGFQTAAWCNEAQSAGSAIQVLWTATQPESPVRTFSAAELKALRQTELSETDPETGKKSHFRGVLLSEVIDKSIGGMNNERKALIDLVVLKGANGSEALVPRSFIVKYPLLLAETENKKPLAGIRSIVPWTSHSKTRQEGLPLETYFVNQITSVELGNYRVRYGTVFLKRRTEPLAMRGEKIFVQACLSCHDSPPGMIKARNWVGNHPSIHGAPTLDERESRALRSYLDQYRAENSPVAKTASR